MKGQKMNHTESNERQDENRTQNEGNAMNDLHDRNASGNDVASNDDASQQGVNMDTGSMGQSNDTGSKVVSGTQHSNSNSEKGGENMSDKKRQPYNGSTAHGITADVEHVQTITAYDNAVKRLDERQSFLIGEYEVIRTDYMATEDVSKRAKLLKKKTVKESQIKAVNKTRKTLSSIKNEIVETERTAQADVEFIDFSAA